MDRLQPRGYSHASSPVRAPTRRRSKLPRFRRRAAIRHFVPRIVRTVTVVLFYGLLITAPSLAQDYAVSLSASATDPAVNHVAEFRAQDFYVYLWLTCSSGTGASAFEAVVVTDYLVIDFESTAGLLARWSTPEHPVLALEGCNEPPLLLGRWRMRNESGDASGSVCLALPWIPAPSCAVVDCFVLAGVPDTIAGVTGFAVGDGVPCIASNGCTGDP